MVAALSSGEDRTRVRRLPEKQVTDRAVLDAVLDAARVAHVAVVDEAGRPYVVPVAHARDGDAVLFHGSTGSRLFRGLAGGAPTCLTVTLLDGPLFHTAPAREAWEARARANVQAELASLSLPGSP